MAGLFNFLTSDIAIDLGTANTLIIYKDEIVVDEPSIIALDKITGKVLAIGHKAMQMHEKTNENIKTIRPLKDGVIADFTAAELMIRGMIKMIETSRSWFFSPSHRMVICIPSGITEVEKRAVKPQDVLNLQAGEIVGIRAIEPSDIKAGTVTPTFKMKVIREVFATIEGMNGKYKEDGSFQTNSKPIPSFNTPFDIEKLTNKITEDCQEMLNIS